MTVIIEKSIVSLMSQEMNNDFILVDNYTSVDTWIYEWSYPLPVLGPLDPAQSVQYNLGQLQQNVSDPNFPLRTISATPYVLDLTNNALIIPGMPNLTAPSTDPIYELIIPPSLSGSFCTSNCYVTDSSSEYSIQAQETITVSLEPLTIETAVITSFIRSHDGQEDYVIELNNGLTLQIPIDSLSVNGSISTAEGARPISNESSLDIDINSQSSSTTHPYLWFSSFYLIYQPCSYH